MGEKAAVSDLEMDLSKAILEADFKDAINHGILVSNLAVLIAKQLNMEEAFINEISIAGMVHDIGKLKLSKYLYGRRRGALAIEEIKYVRMHSTFSYEVMKKMQFSEFIQSSVYHHHENFDGSGYPDNLVGTAIPFGARVLRCCDVFAALVSKRPYRDAFDIETALDLMIDEVKNFDMRVFLAFLEVVHSSEFEKIREFVTLCNKAT